MALPDKCSQEVPSKLEMQCKKDFHFSFDLVGILLRTMVFVCVYRTL